MSRCLNSLQSIALVLCLVVSRKICPTNNFVSTSSSSRYQRLCLSTLPRKALSEEALLRGFAVLWSFSCKLSTSKGQAGPQRVLCAPSSQDTWVSIWEAPRYKDLCCCLSAATSGEGKSRKENQTCSGSALGKNFFRYVGTSFPQTARLRQRQVQERMMCASGHRFYRKPSSRRGAGDGGLFALQLKLH